MCATNRAHGHSAPDRIENEIRLTRQDCRAIGSPFKPEFVFPRPPSCVPTLECWHAPTITWHSMRDRDQPKPTTPCNPVPSHVPLPDQKSAINGCGHSPCAAVSSRRVIVRCIRVRTTVRSCQPTIRGATRANSRRLAFRGGRPARAAPGTGSSAHALQAARGGTKARPRPHRHAAQDKRAQ